MAYFYITGWGNKGSGNSGADPCTTTASLPSVNPGSLNLPDTPDDIPPDNNDGIVMGHFVTYIDTNGTPSGTKCVPGTLDICVPVLTK
jgi:hypothetical protein